MNEPLMTIDSTCSAAPRRALVDVLEAYLADLERGAIPNQELLLAAHPELADELRPYLDSLQMLHGVTREMRAPAITTNGSGDATLESKPQQIGDYRIVREIGRGGMGIVYEAHQTSLNRRVALKILPFAAVLDQRQIARFRNEAQAAAQLHHPHIVPVFAVGQEHGVYFYAMQFVDGQSLEEAISDLRRHANGLGECSTKAAGAARGSTTTIQLDAGAARPSHRSIRQSNFFHTVARLGKEAAEALHHAHEYGIVHRDVKPSNLLVDHSGKLWVTDFGLARMQTDSGVTLTGDVIGTLRYMSPEQADGRSALVDARTDVYSLGVTLYELLTQRHAFPGDDRQSLLRQIVSEDPIAPRRLNSAIPVDLETIVLGAMAKSRDERYASAQALADDLDRFLSGKPTHARRPTLADRAVKWARRHRSLVVVATCAMFLLSVVSAVGMVLLAREQAQTAAARDQAEINARNAQASFERAERHFKQARDTVDHFGMRLADRLMEVPGTERVRRDLLVDTLGYYRQFMQEAGNDPELRHELALAHFKSGVIAAKLGAIQPAIAEYQAAQKLLAEPSTTGSARAEQRAQLALTHNNLGLLLASRGEVDGAREQYAAAIAIQQRLVEQHADNPIFASQLSESEANSAMLLDQLGDVAGAERSLRRAVDVLRPLAESRPDELKYARNLAIACNNLSFVLRKHDMHEAQNAAREAITILERLTKQHSGSAAYLGDLALCYNNMAALQSQRQRVSEAIDWHAKAIGLQERLVRTAPAVVRHRSDLAISLNNLGVAYCRAGREVDADDAFDRARTLFATLADDYPNELTYRSAMATLLNNQALALADTERHEDAIQLYETAIESQRMCWEQSPESSLMREVLSKMYYNYGQSLRKTGNLREAMKAALARRELWQGNGERLLGVAVELAEIGGVARDNSTMEDVRQALDHELIATLRRAHESGWIREFDLAGDKRFAYLHGDKRFTALIAEFSDSPMESSAEQPARSAERKLTK
ncbi:MAG: serine/threonine-protein kinase [Pirellulales bacterium]